MVQETDILIRWAKNNKSGYQILNHRIEYQLSTYREIKTEYNLCGKNDLLQRRGFDSLQQQVVRLMQDYQKVFSLSTIKNEDGASFLNIL